MKIYKKETAAIFIAGFALAVCAAAIGKDVDVNKKQGPLFRKGDVIVIEGDSRCNRRSPPLYTTWPYLRMNNWHITWAEKFEEWIFCNRPDLRLEIKTTAAGGSTILSIIDRYEPVVKKLKPQWILMMVGVNDRHIYKDLKKFKDGLARYCTMAAADLKARVIFIHAPVLKEADDKKEHARWGEEAKKTIVKNNGIFIDLHDEIIQREKELKELWPHHTIKSFEDGHYNAVGAEIISTLLLEKLGFITIHK